MISIIIPERNEKNLYLVCKDIDLLPFTVQVVIAHDKDGEGKGVALRVALKETQGEYICFLDGDLDIKPRMLLRLLPFLDDGYDIVVGTKNLNSLPFRRKIITILSRIYIRVLFGLTVDSQTGIKIFKREALPEWSTNGFAVDIEILAKARKLGKTMVEVPIEVTITKQVPLKAIWKTLIESIKIRLAL